MRIATTTTHIVPERLVFLVPEVPALLRAKILWVIDNGEHFYKRDYKAFRNTEQVCQMEL